MKNLYLYYVREFILYGVPIPYDLLSDPESSMMHTRQEERVAKQDFGSEIGRLAFTKPMQTHLPGAKEHNEMIRRAQEYFGD